MCNLQKRMETSFLSFSSLWLANSFFFCIGHFSKLCCCCGASNFYPIITLCLTDCWNCLARGLILVPNSMYCLKVVFWVLFFASEELRNEQKLHLLLSSWKTVRIWKKKQKYQCLKMSQICLLLQELRAKRAWMENIKNCFLKKVVNLKQFVIKKSDKIGKSRNPIKKRHLTIFAVLS